MLVPGLGHAAGLDAVAVYFECEVLGVAVEVLPVGVGVVRYHACEHALTDEVLHDVDHASCVSEFVEAMGFVYIELGSQTS